MSKAAKDYELTYFRRMIGEPAGVALHKPRLRIDEANFAMALVERWGIVAARPDGEDTAGRQQLRDMKPTELAKEACDIAEATFTEFHERGWFVELPNIATVEERAKEQEKRTRKAQLATPTMSTGEIR